MHTEIAIEQHLVTSLAPHPLSAEIFGQLGPDQFADLKADIADKGLRYPLEVVPRDLAGDGTGPQWVICGSQRLRAIVELGWEQAPCVRRPELMDEEGIREWLIKDNILRRQLTPGQMYRAGKELERIYSARAEQRQHAQLQQGCTGPLRPIDLDGEKGQTRDQVAHQLGTSGKTYDRVKQVFESDDDELKAQLDQGLVSISAAAKKVGKPAHQATAMDSDDERGMPLRFARYQTAVEKFLKWLEANEPAKFEHLAPKTRPKLEDLRDLAIEQLEQVP